MRHAENPSSFSLGCCDSPLKFHLKGRIVKKGHALILAPMLGLCFLNPVAWAVTQRTVTVKASGGDYTSLAAAIAGESKNLVGLDRQLTIACYASAAPDMPTARLDPADGWVTDATHYVRVMVPPGERHTGKWDPTKYYRSMVNYQTSFESLLPYTRIEGVQFYVDPSQFLPGWSIWFSYCRNCLIDGVLHNGWWGNDGSGRITLTDAFHLTVSGGTVVRNTIVVGQLMACARMAWEPVEYDNFTCINEGWGGTGLNGIDFSNHSNTGHVIRNSYCGGATAGCYFGPASAVTITNSASSDNTGDIPNVSISAAMFVNPASPLPDLNLQAGSFLRGKGTSLSGIFTTDCAGRPRPSTGAWDVGACEFAGGSPPPPSQNELWIRALYQDLLARAPNPTELSQALAQLNGGASRSTFVQNLCAGSEGAGKITGLVRVSF
jgi:hypothetical protein